MSTKPPGRGRRRWPAVAAERRAVVPSRTERGETCTIIVCRYEHGPLVVYFHGSRETSAALTPVEADELLAALADAIT